MKAFAIGLVLVASAAAAEAPETSLRPVARPGSETPAATASVPAPEAPAAVEAAAETPDLPALPVPAAEEGDEASILMTLMNAGVSPEEAPELPQAAEEASGADVASELLNAVIGTAPAAEADLATPEETPAPVVEPAAEVEVQAEPEPEPAPPPAPEENSRLEAPDPETVTLSSNASQPWYEIDASKFAPAASVRPKARAVPDPITRTGAEARAEWFNVALSPYAPARSLRPDARPPSILRLARAAQEQREADMALQQRGAVCGDIAIQGEAIGTVPGAGACGVENAVRVRSVAGIALSQPAVLDCQTARTFKDWVVNGMLPAVGNEGGGAESIHVMAHYICRNRIGTRSTRLSEHSFGHAIDVGGIRLRDGSRISVLRGWNTDDDGAQLRQMHRAACGMFGTVLGPESNAAHRDHFHFDTARYRSGSYCR